MMIAIWWRGRKPQPTARPTPACLVIHIFFIGCVTVAVSAMDKESAPVAAPRPTPRAAPRHQAPEPAPTPIPMPRMRLASPPQPVIQEDTEEEFCEDQSEPLSPRTSDSMSVQSLDEEPQESALRGGVGLRRQVTKSLLFDFDPLLSQQFGPDDLAHAASLASLAEEHEDEYNVQEEQDEQPPEYSNGPVEEEHIYDPVAHDDSSGDDLEPPEPPPRNDSIPREKWDQIPAALVGNSGGVEGELKAAVRRVTIGGRAVRSFRSFMGDATERNASPAPPFEALKRPTGETAVHEGRLTFNGRDKVRTLAKLTTKNFSWYPDTGKRWTHWSLEHACEVASVTIQESPAFEIINCDGMCCRSICWVAQSEEERDRWMAKVAVALTNETRMHHVASRLGWLYLKEGVGGAWSASWLSLQGRRLRYLLPSQELQEIDLRKARCFVKDGDLQDGIIAGQELFVVQLGNSSLYLQGPMPKVTERWRLAIQSAILRNGKSLREQQLTVNDVVALVEMCTNFVITNGITSEGIYRLAGQSSKVTALLEALKKNPHEVALTRAEYNEHLVASALKRFFVGLPEPLLSKELMASLGRAKSLEAKGRLIRHALNSVAFATLRKVLAHLHLITLEHARNKMDGRNLATVWAVGLTHATDADIVTLTTLIEEFPAVFEVDEAEMQKENKLLRVLERLHSAPPQTGGAGDLRIWLTLGNANSTDTVQVLLNPSKTAADVVQEAAATSSWQLQEVLLGGALWRPLHPSELVMEVVARWGYWADEDRAHNKLVLGPSTFYDELRPLALPPASAYGQFKFAVPEVRAYKTRFMQLLDGKVTSAKIKGSSPVVVGEWPIKNMSWYQGYDSKRGPNGDKRWYLTLVSKDGKSAARSKERPFVGCTIAMERRQDLLDWCASLVLSQHPDGI
ncbi:Hypothetical predicted protein [Cloeon dipterum]|uniref:Rho-GAP domain-containing protein n=1 Tax=Cloeon dipterum TaxID=197152 RepID=A0A8S1D469_9INSE|nr:Hypothetical predicted protein [Cloeon dipterum]